MANPDTETTPPGTPVTINPVDNDAPGENPFDPSTVRLIDPETNTPTTQVVVPGQGTWTVDTETGLVTFVPEPEFSGDASITYEVTDTAGNTVTETITVTVEGITTVGGITEPAPAPGGSSLPRTGGPFAPLTALAIALTGFGAVLLTGSRRLRTAK